MKLTGKGRRRKPRGQNGTAGRVIRAPGPPRVRWIGGTALLICVFIHKERVVFQKEGCMSLVGAGTAVCHICSHPLHAEATSFQGAGSPQLHPTLLPRQAVLLLCRRGFS